MELAQAYPLELSPCSGHSPTSKASKVAKMASKSHVSSSSLRSMATVLTTKPLPWYQCQKKKKNPSVMQKPSQTVDKVAPSPPAVKAHLTRVVASSTAFLRGVDLSSIYKAATWAATTFAVHYQLDLRAKAESSFVHAVLASALS